MSVRPIEEHRSLATDLAKLLASEGADDQAVQSMLQQLGYPSAHDGAEESIDPSDFTSGDNIGIYSPGIIDGETWYTRNIALKEKWTFFADVQSIPPKSHRKRVVLLGESVARGFLLDPGYTPAGVLETLLNSTVAGGEAYEVIDLAETNLGMQGMMQRYMQCTMLQPDLVIFLGGNNWRADMEVGIVTNADSFKKLKEGIRQSGSIVGVKGVIEELFAGLVASFMQYVHEISEKHKIKTIFAIPEFNLLDCRSTPGERFVTKLPGEGTQQWVAARKMAEAALSDGRFEEALNSAADMVNIDPSHPLGYEIMADCNLSQGNHAAARDNFELARDSAIFCRTNSKPRIYRVIRETIKANAKRYGIEVVDIPAVFSDHLNGKVPGRNLFLDYCHFTVEGIQVSMHAVAQKVLILLTDGQASVQIKPESIQADQQVNAMAHLFAAIHNAHWGQSYEILHYHCNRSLQYSREMAKTMIYYCDMISRRTDNILCKSFEVLITNFKFDRYIHALRSQRNTKSMELDLVNAMIAALKQAGINLTDYINDLRNKEHSVTGQPVNLLQSYYHLTSYDEFHGSKAAFFQARDPQSRFYMIGKKNFPVTFSVTLRTPSPVEDLARVTVIVNGVPVSDIEVSTKWSSHTIAITGDICVDGVNVVTFLWPVPIHNEQASAIHSARHSNSDAFFIIDAVYCVFGEIIHFKAEGNSDNNFAQN